MRNILLLFCGCTVSVNSLFILDGQICEKVFDFNFKARTLKYPFRGNGIYVYEDTNDLSRIELERMTATTVVY